MTTSTPPAWAWLSECSVPVGAYQHKVMDSLTPDPSYFPADVAGVKESLPTDPCPDCGGSHKPWVLCHEYGQMREEALSTDPRPLPDADTLGERNDSESPIDSRETPDSATLRERNGDDPTGEDVWPLERDGVHSVRETPTKLRVGARNEHPERDVSQTGNAPDTGNIEWVCNDCGQDRYGQCLGVSTWHMGRCDICCEEMAVTEPRDFGNGGTTCTPNPFPEVLYSMMVEAHNRDEGDPDIHGSHEYGANPKDGDPTCMVTAPADSFVEKCPVCLHEMENDEGILCDHCNEPTGPGSFAVVNGPGGVFVYHLHCYDEVYWGGKDDGQEQDTDAGTIPLWKQALWLARNIEDLHSPRPDVVSDDELRGMTLIRVLGIGADEHGDEVFRKSSEELHEDRVEEWSDGEFYDLVDRFGGELGSVETSTVTDKC